MSDFIRTKGGFHANTATQRARTSGAAFGLPKVERYLESLAKYAQRPNRSRTEGGTTRSGAPMRSIRETLVNRGPGIRAAANYTPTPRVGILKATAKAVGKVGGAVAKGAARFAGPVGAGLLALDAYDTVKAAKETIGAARELGRVRAAGREAEQGTAAIKKAMYSKYPMAGTEYEAASKKLPKLKSGTKATGGTITGIKIN